MVCINFVTLDSDKSLETDFFFMSNEVFNWISKNLFPTKAAFIVSLNLSIIHMSLS